MLDQFDVRTNIIYSSMFFMAGGIIYLYKEQHKIFYLSDRLFLHCSSFN